VSDTESSKEDPLSSIRELHKSLTGGLDVKPIDVSRELPRHPTKVYTKRSLSKIKKIVVHTTDANWSLQELVEFDLGPNHISKTGCPAITYHDVIMPSGVVYHCLPYNEVSWHVGNHNGESVAVAMMYKCTSNNKDVFPPPDSEVKALISHCGKLCIKFNLDPSNVVGHRELFGTGWFWSKGHKRLRKTCPGLQVDLDSLRKKVARYMQIFLRLEGSYLGNIDGIWGPKSKMALERYKQKK
jgi:hypothetical protein